MEKKEYYSWPKDATKPVKDYGPSFPSLDTGFSFHREDGPSQPKEYWFRYILFGYLEYDALKADDVEQFYYRKVYKLMRARHV
jgi:hypothetical protein